MDQNEAVSVSPDRVKPADPNAPRRTLLLTGASRGIGHATVIRFSSAGWRVLTCSRHPFPEQCPWGAGPEDHIQVDLADHDDTARAIAEVRERLEDGELHALVNNAAISPKAEGGGRLGSIDTDVDTWSHVFRVNFFAPIMMARGLLEELKAAKGSVVNVTSIAGSRVHPFAGAAYATSKAALASLTREMASDFGRFGVRVNSIAPGEIDTAILSPGTEKIVDQQIPLHRLGTPDEVAKIIYVLCTETSSYVNGAEIHINGGQHV
jgi:NAD(P)-dependent dehydrogenase (short-subunit alcohol dehydrogenase family)